MDLTVGKRSLNGELLIELSIGALQVSLFFSMDCDLAIKGYGLWINTKTLLRSDKDELWFKYITILRVLMVISLVKGQKLFEHHQYFLL